MSKIHRRGVQRKKKEIGKIMVVNGKINYIIIYIIDYTKHFFEHPNEN